MNYYNRRPVQHIDGTLVFQNEQDRESERDVAKKLEIAWQCSVHSFGALSPIDWYAVRDGRTTALLELKARTHPADKYPTVFLNVRKWLALSLGACGMGVPAIFVVKFTDQIRWTPLASVDARDHRIAGCATLVKSVNDIEPVIEVPVSQMTELREQESAA